MVDDQKTPEMEDEPTEADLEILKEIEGEAEKKPEPPKEKKEEEKPKTDKEPDPVDDGEDDDLSEGEDDKDEGRKPKFVRLEKHLKMRDKVKDLESQLEKAKDSKPEDKKQAKEEIEAEIETIADELGLSAEKTKKLLKLAENGAYTRIRAELGDKLDNLATAEQSRLEEAETAKQERIWNKQFDELKTEFPKEAEHIQSKKGTIKKLAFSTSYSKTPLNVIYRGVDGLRSTKTKTVEGGRGGSSKAGTTDFAKIVSNNDQSAIADMDADTFKDFNKYITDNNL